MTDLIELTAEVAASYLAANKADSGEIAMIVRTIHEALARAEQGGSAWS